MPDPTAPPPLQPLAEHRCPLCGGPNGCAAAASGSFATPCWCSATRIPADVLARIPEAQRGLACVCARCAAGGQAAAAARQVPGGRSAGIRPVGQ